MSAELYRQGVDAWNERDVERFIGLCQPDVEFRSVLTRVEGGGAYRGYDGLRRYFADLDETLPDARIDLASVEEHGDWLVAACRLHGTGMASGVPLEWEIGQAVRVRDGLFEQVITESSREQALAAAGIV